MVRTAAAVCVLAVGAIGLVFPLVPGVPLIIAGLALRGGSHPWTASARRWVEAWRLRARPDAAAPEIETDASSRGA